MVPIVRGVKRDSMAEGLFTVARAPVKDFVWERHSEWRWISARSTTGEVVHRPTMTPLMRYISRVPECNPVEPFIQYGGRSGLGQTANVCARDGVSRARVTDQSRALIFELKTVYSWTETMVIW